MSNSLLVPVPARELYLRGDGALKCRPILENRPGVVFIDDFYSSAAFMAQLSEDCYKNGKFENLAYFEPFYLKDFIAGKPRVKGLR